MEADDQSQRVQNHVNVSIIISTHNRKEELIRTINNILENTSGIIEIIVVSANSTDGTDEEIRSLFPEIRLIIAPDVGWGEANNIGAKIAKGDYFYFSGPDMEFENGWLSETVKVASQVKNLGSIGCVLFRPYPRKGVLITGGSNLTFLYLIHRGIDLSESEYELFKKRGQLQDVDAVHYPLVPREVYFKVGGFDPEYFYSADETDLGMRIKKLGLRNVVFFGKWTKTDMTPFSKKAFYYWRRNRIRFIIKMNNFLALPVALAYPFAMLAAEWLYYSVKRDEEFKHLLVEAIVWNLQNFKTTREIKNLKHL